MAEPQQKSEAEYLKDLDSRSLERKVIDSEIPGTEALMRLPADKISETLTRILLMGNIVALHLEVGKPIKVSFYETSSFGKGKMNQGLSLVSPEALEEAARKRKEQGRP